METPFNPPIVPAAEACLEQIVRTIFPERIYLLANREPGRGTESIFRETIADEPPTGSLLLFILYDKATGDQHLLQHRLEYVLPAHPSIHVILMEAQKFLAELECGHPFAATIHRRAPVIYGSRPNLQVEVNSSFTTPFNEMELLQLATEMHGAAGSCLNEDHSSSIFNLHLSMEFALKSIIRRYMQWTPETRNLLRLQEYALFVQPDIEEIFTPSNFLLHSLHTAFNRRHSPGFSISRDELQELQSSIQKLIELCQAS